ncbi:AfsR/SARP family transcriptional regulator [Nonomuraea cavernae]|uniref:SARP family transcriptional regulator n=1 Tax=Nonomuraea cavernae TaxID=2045107 RepID=A0A918DQ70_9ACTN|nr:BTAD domain-containing putative transcriptional regulator [Nonomuraea cavernae]MCA2189670.1 tetratricopeptide repeat protein [Nonomuraea cavernae]GGO77485.1 SARP family transcriptional regulator [Nonomuraea cavernae]
MTLDAPHGGDLTFTVLGPVRVCGGGAVSALGRSQRRGLLGFLLLNAGRVVTMEAVIDALWGGAPPTSARAQIYSGIHVIRRELRVLGIDEVVSSRGGYTLRADAANLDLALFEECARQAGAGQRPEQVVRSLRRGLALWSGPALSDASGAYVEAVRAHLEETRLGCVERLIEAELALGRHHHAIGELRRLVTEHPLRERLHAQLMLALYRDGRRTEALDLSRDLRHRLVEEHGLDPSLAVIELEQAILRADPALAPPNGFLSGSVTAGPARAHSGAPAQLPADTFDFTGRDRELAQALPVLAVLAGEQGNAPPICAVTGPPGVGKTVFAVHAAHRIRESYPDGQLFVDLRGADSRPAAPAEALSGFLRALGVDGREIPQGRDERSALYRTMLADRRVLVVLDNATDESQVRPLLPGAGACAVLVTSRRRLAGLGAQTTVELLPFDGEESVELLGRIAGSERVAAEDREAREVARLCGGLPLALRIAGSRLAARPHRRIGELARRLADEQRRLDELSYSGLAVRAGLDLSYQALGEAERRLLRRLAFLDVPEAGAWLAIAVSGERPADTEEMLEGLTDIHLLRVTGVDGTGQIRYGMHDLVRTYCRERMAEEETADTALSVLSSAARHLLRLAAEARGANRGHDYYARLAEELVVPMEEEIVRHAAEHAVDWLEAEAATVFGVLRQTSAHGLFDECWRIALMGGWLYDIRCCASEYREMLSIAGRAAEESGDRRAQAIVPALSAELGVLTGALEEAVLTLEPAERIFVEIGDEHGLAEVWRMLAHLERTRGEHAVALRRYERIRETFRLLDDHSGEAHTLRSIGQIHLVEGRVAEALRYLEEAVRVAEKSRGDWKRLNTLFWLGEVYLRVGRAGEARDAFLTVAEAADRVGDFTGGAFARLGLAQVAIEADDHRQARTQLALALDHAERSELALVLCKIGLAVGGALLRLGDLAQAGETIERLLPRIDSLASPLMRAEAAELLARVREGRGDGAGPASGAEWRKGV